MTLKDTGDIYRARETPQNVSGSHLNSEEKSVSFRGCPESGLHHGVRVLSDAEWPSQAGLCYRDKSFMLIPHRLWYLIDTFVQSKTLALDPGDHKGIARP